MQNPESLQYLVSNIDILNKLKSFSIKIIIYENLQNIININELLPTKYCAICILIKTTINSGHWTCLVRQDKTLYYFDSYGVPVDGELKNISPHLRYNLNEKTKYLSKLLRKSNFILKQNEHQYQDYSENISTCGKWCTAFIDFILSNYNNNIPKFEKEIQSLCDLYENKFGKTNHIQDHVVNTIYNNIMENSI